MVHLNKQQNHNLLSLTGRSVPQSIIMFCLPMFVLFPVSKHQT